MSDPGCQDPFCAGFSLPFELCLPFELVEATDVDPAPSPLSEFAAKMDLLPIEERLRVLKRVWDSRPDIREALPWYAAVFENLDGG